MKKNYFVLPLVITPCLVQNAVAQEKGEQRPNVVFIYADDIGFGDFSCNGANTIHTPNVDRAAAQGVRFTNAHSAAATSTPSRYAMLTGEYAWRKAGTGIADGDAGSIIRPDRYTMPDMFKQAGYTTAVVGKWHLGLGDKGGEQDWNKPLKPGTNDIGFDYSFIMAATGDRVPCVFVENDQVINLDPADPIQVSYKKNFPGEPTGKDNPELLVMHPSHGHDMSIVNGISRIGFMKGGKSALWKDDKIAETLTDKAVSFIETHKDRPFFLYFATQDAHVPRVPGAQFVGKSGMGPRGDCLLEFDWSVGEVLNALERLGLDKNTLVIISSDNGPVVDDGYKDKAEELLNGHTPSGPWRGNKYSAFEGGTAVPVIVRWPRKIKKAGDSDVLMSQIDWLASLGALVNARLPKGSAPDSYDRLGNLIGTDRTDRPWIVEQSMNHTLSVRTKDWKYIEPNDDPTTFMKAEKIETGNLNVPQLYEMEKVSEQENVAEKYPKKVFELQTILRQVRNKRIKM